MSAIIRDYNQNRFDFNGLGGNLSEIISALKAYPSTKKIDLHASIFFNVSFQGTMMGTAYKAFDEFLRSSWKQELPKPNEMRDLKVVLCYIFDQFERGIERIHLSTCFYTAVQVSSLAKKISNREGRPYISPPFPKYFPHGDHSVKSRAFRSFDENAMMIQLDRNRQWIKDFYSATHQFAHLVSSNSPLIEPIKEYFATCFFAKQPLYYAHFKQYILLFNLESILQQKHPVAELGKKLIDPEKMDLEEQKKIRDWVKALNANQNRICLDHFESVLKKIASFINRTFPTFSCYVRLLLLLEKEGCQLITKTHIEHHLERSKYKPGDSITCNGIEYILGDRLSPTEETVGSRNLIFALKDNDNLVVKIANNKFKLPMLALKYLHPEEHEGIYPAFVTKNGNDSSGRYLILEKLTMPLSRYQWTSDSSLLNENDRKIALILSNQLILFQNKNKSLNLSLDHLMFSQEGCLKSIKLLKFEPGDYGKWEKFAIDVSKGNPFVLHYLMRTSKLFQHKIARYYQRALLDTFEAGEVKASEENGNWGDYEKTLKKLGENAVTIEKETFNEIMEYLCRENRYTSKQEPLLKKEIRTMLREAYYRSPTPGTIDPSLKTSVIAEFKKTTLVENTPFGVSRASFCNKLKRDFLISDRYYVEQYALLMKYNQAVIQERASKNQHD